MDNINNKKTLIKPVEHIQALIGSFLAIGSVSKAKSGQRIQFALQDERMCFLLVKGDCDVKRCEDSLLLTTVRAPSLLGVSDFTLNPNDLIIQAATAIEYIYIPLNKFLLHIDECNLWKSVAYSLMYISSRFNEYMKSTTAIPNYALICNLLRALCEEDFETRATISAVQYIQERTSLSRSGVMKTLSELNTGGYIVIKRGLLIKINDLPEKY